MALEPEQTYAYRLRDNVECDSYRYATTRRYDSRGRKTPQLTSLFLKIERIWAMPSHWTFQIKPIAKLLKEEINGGLWLDPYAGNYSPAQIKNDLRPNTKAEFHQDALEFLQGQNGQQYAGVLYDPPYSLRQLKECYDSIGIKPDPAIFRGDYIAKQKDILSRLVKPNGKAICFGWNSIGLGKKRGFKLERILLVAHGRSHNDTIVTVERKVNETLVF